MLRRFVRHFSQGKQFVVNLVTPHSTIVNELPVDQVNLQTERGDIGILSDHVPTIEQLKPGIVELFYQKEGHLTRSKWFVSGGFMAMHPDGRLDISVPEAVETSQLNQASIGRGLEDCEKRIGKCNEPAELARLEIEQSVYKSLSAALD